MSRFFEKPDSLDFDPTADEEMPEMKISGIAKIDLLEVGYLLENILQPFSSACPEGIYMPHRLNPVLLPHNSYHQNEYDANGALVQRFIVTIDDITDTVSDKRDRIVLSQRVARDKHRYLSATPTMPYWGIYAARALAEDLVIRRQRHLCHRSTNKQALVRMFPTLDLPSRNTEEDPHGVTYDQRLAYVQDLQNRIEDLFLPVEREIDGFIDENEWNYYFFEHRSALMILKKGPDYRIQQWEREHGHEFP